MHRESDSVFGTLKKTLETASVYRKPSTTNKQHTKQQHNTHISKNLKLQNSNQQNSKIPKNPKVQKPKNPIIQKSKNPKSKNPKLFTSTESCNCSWNFGIWIFGFFDFFDFRSRCLVTVMDKWAERAFLRVVGGGEHIYIYTCIHRYTYMHIYTSAYI